jgi:UrcA family protein
MKTMLGKVAAAVFATIVFSSAVIADEVQEVTVQAKRAFSTTVTERLAGGVPILDISVSYGVRTTDLDLATHSGATVLEQRVKDAAKAACREISRQYPDSTPGERDCASVAASKAMPQVKQLVAAAEQQAHKG